jgi:prepilin-type N-terminal cleavage/methylation domain-containing protein
MSTQEAQQIEGTDHARQLAGNPSSPARRRPKATQGFTLIEIMIALFILLTVLVAMISTTVMIVRANAFSKTLTTATTLAKDRMERLKNTHYNSLAGGTDYAAADGTVQAGATGAIYTRTWTVTADGTPAADMRTLAVTVTWNWNNTAHNVNLQTIVAR